MVAVHTQIQAKDPGFASAQINSIVYLVILSGKTVFGYDLSSYTQPVATVIQKIKDQFGQYFGYESEKYEVFFAIRRGRTLGRWFRESSRGWREQQYWANGYSQDKDECRRSNTSQKRKPLV